jgi:hypothetical protein
LIEFTASNLGSTVKHLYAKLEDGLAKVEAIGIQGTGQSARTTLPYHSALEAGCIATSSNLPFRQIAAYHHRTCRNRVSLLVTGNPCHECSSAILPALKYPNVNLCRNLT